MNLVEELQWRGMIQDIMPGTEALLNKEKVRGYIGFDPTSDSLHIGSLVPILLLVHLQKAGHHPIALIGGATGMVGDPSGKSEERNLLSEEQLNMNILGVKKQLEQFLDFNPSLPNKAILLNNYDWFKQISFISFLRDVGKHITINYMMSKDSVRKRIEGETGISYTEFAYQLMQGYDFLWLNEHHQCQLQMGGSDQWGNITTGTELIRKMKGKEAFAFTCPLITKADGGKFGKTEKGNVWIDPNRTTPYQFYQFWLNAADEDAIKWIKIFTLLPKETIETIIEDHLTNPGARLLQKKLAEEITKFVHGENGISQALETTQKLFSQQQLPAESLSKEDLEHMEGVSKISISKSTIEAGVSLVQLLADTGILPSKGEARKMVAGGGISINRQKINQADIMVENQHLLHNSFILIQKGKKNYYLLEAI
jgi:tyrosyl-tRNA synthetase